MGEFIIGRVKGEDGKHLCIDSVFNSVVNLPSPTSDMIGRHVYVGAALPRTVYSCDGQSWYLQGILFDKIESNSKVILNVKNFDVDIHAQPGMNYINWTVSGFKVEYGLDSAPIGVSGILKIGDINIVLNEFSDCKSEFDPAPDFAMINTVLEGNYLTENNIEYMEIACAIDNSNFFDEIFDILVFVHFGFQSSVNVDPQAFCDSLPPISLELDFKF